MLDYYGTKRLSAEPMTLGDYNKLRGWMMPEDENPAAPGYTVVYEDGYRSWSPADKFEAAYRPINAMDFAGALVALKGGHRVARAGWNGKGMWVALTPGSSIPAHAARNGHAAEHLAKELPDEDDQITLLPHIDMRAADGSMVIGWLASQTDMLAEDWMILD